MKSLKGIQVFAKIGQVLSKILFIFAIIGCAFCALGLLSVATVGLNQEIVINGTTMTLQEYIETEANMSLNTVYATLIVATILCGEEIYLAKVSNNYFKRELEVGHPFTRELVKKLRTLGIIVLAVSFGVGLVCSIGLEIAKKVTGDIAKLDLNGYGQLGTGLGMILISYLCEYVVEKEEKDQKPEEAPIANNIEE